MADRYISTRPPLGLYGVVKLQQYVQTHGSHANRFNVVKIAHIGLHNFIQELEETPSQKIIQDQLKNVMLELACHHVLGQTAISMISDIALTIEILEDDLRPTVIEVAVSLCNRMHEFIHATYHNQLYNAPNLYFELENGKMTR